MKADEIGMSSRHAWSGRGRLLQLIGGRSLDELHYDQLHSIVQEWLLPNGVEPENFPSESIANSRSGDIERTSDFLKRRGFDEFSKMISARGTWESALLQLFLLARVRHYAVSYLSLQEGRDWDGPRTEFAHTSMLIKAALAVLGRGQVVMASFRAWFLPFRFSLDPMRHLRSVYCIILKSKRTGSVLQRHHRLTMQWSRLRFRISATGLRRVLRLVLYARPNGLAERLLGKVFKGRSFRRNVSLGILLLFPGAKTLTREQWTTLLANLEEYFTSRLRELRRVLSPDSAKNHGIVKLIKIAFGVVACRVATRNSHEKDEGEFILTTLRLAYSWGITYPLVDNTLDSCQVSVAKRRDLTDALNALFEGHLSSALFSSTDPLVIEVVGRLQEVIEIIPNHRRKFARRTMLYLLEAHRRDAEMRASAIRQPMATGKEHEIWRTSVLKAALIRLATIEICGTPIDCSILANQLFCAPINQFGDDLWDVHEDSADDRVTPFTAYLSGFSQRNPFKFFLHYCLAVSSSESGERRRAMLIGLLETSACLIRSQALECRFGESIRQHVLELIVTLNPNWSLSDIWHIPHVDADAVLFQLEESILWRSA